MKVPPTSSPKCGEELGIHTLRRCRKRAYIPDTVIAWLIHRPSQPWTYESVITSTPGTWLWYYIDCTLASASTTDNGIFPELVNNYFPTCWQHVIDSIAQISPAAMLTHVWTYSHFPKCWPLVTCVDVGDLQDSIFIAGFVDKHERNLWDIFIYLSLQ